MKDVALRLDCATGQPISIEACNANLGESAVRIFINREVPVEDVQPALTRAGEMLAWIDRVGRQVTLVLASCRSGKKKRPAVIDGPGVFVFTYRVQYYRVSAMVSLAPKGARTRPSRMYRRWTRYSPF